MLMLGKGALRFTNAPYVSAGWPGARVSRWGSQPETGNQMHLVYVVQSLNLNLNLEIGHIGNGTTGSQSDIHAADITDADIQRPCAASGGDPRSCKGS